MSPSPTPSSRLPPNTLTPQRKHRKLLKDGSGCEVWPEAIERVFVQGLREYWKSPMATYSQSRGRSRWRNQFLVDYLQKAGIIRSKKQVASHIQVLRNMWKGEAEFALVAGGDELVEAGLPLPLGIKQEDQFEQDVLFADYDDNDSPSPNSNSPGYPSPDVLSSEFTPSPQQQIYPLEPSHPPNAHQGTFVPDTHSNGYAFPASPSNPGDFAGAAHGPNSLRQSPLRDPHFSATSSTTTSTPHSTTAIAPSSSHSRLLSQNSASYTGFYSPKATSLSLYAHGMTPFTVRLDVITMAQLSSQSSPLVLGIRLTIPPTSDYRNPNLSGFMGSLQLSGLWTTSGKCTTKVYSNRVCISEECEALNVSTVDVGVVTAALPESALSRCRWFDADATTTIMQEVMADGELLICIQYELNRQTSNGLPSAQLVGHQEYRSEVSPKVQQHGRPDATYVAYPQFPQAQACARRGTQLPYALGSASALRHTTSTSMSF
ncbi:hypothetical protein BDN72DRAFT_852793 [Pluteus cervinus]|uniref:Uncharacterized protein n=1 Tax=Pluteus cervinus TaxID=181527 RepID=A0ACD3BEY5_9AGAR|nr:hypothetical protein BDN72DRAFT_852793 [Pluteus cervinus]